MKPTQHELETMQEELRAGMAECRSNIRLEGSLLEEDLSVLQSAQLAYNRRLNAIEEEKKRFGKLDRELAEIDGRLKDYTRGAKRPRVPRADCRKPTMDELVGMLKGLDPTRLNELLNKIA